MLYLRFGKSVLLPSCLMLLLNIGPALADGSPDIEEELEILDENLEEDAYLHLGRGFLDPLLEPYDRLRDNATKNLGLDWGIGVSYLGQTRSEGGSNKSANNVEVDVGAIWDLVDSKTIGQGSLNLLTTNIWELRNASKTGEVTESAGTAFPISDSSNLDAIRQLFWRQELFDGGLEVMAGQVEASLFTDDNSYANNDRDKFIAETWTNTTRSAVNIFGMGLGGRIRPNESFYISGGLIDGNASDDGPRGPNSFLSGEYVYYGEIALTPNFEGFGKGIYRISPYFADDARNEREEGKGVSISFEQETPWPWQPALWLRGSVSEDRKNALTSFLGGGVVFNEPFERFNRDKWGLAFGWGRPDDGDARDSTYLFETYYRAQLTRRLEFGPHLQAHIRPADKRDRDAVFVGGIRLMARF